MKISRENENQVCSGLAAANLGEKYLYLVIYLFIHSFNFASASVKTQEKIQLYSYTDSSYDGKRGPFNIQELIKHKTGILIKILSMWIKKTFKTDEHDALVFIQRSFTCKS